MTLWIKKKINYKALRGCEPMCKKSPKSKSHIQTAQNQKGAQIQDDYGLCQPRKALTPIHKSPLHQAWIISTQFSIKIEMKDYSPSKPLLFCSIEIN